MSDHAAELESMKQLLEWLGHHPDLLPEAPPALDEAIVRERAVEDHVCLKCGEETQGFFWIQPTEWTFGTGRWMDLCPAHCALVMEIAASGRLT